MTSLLLTITEGPNAGRTVSANESMVVGRGARADFSVMDFRMSRMHFEIAVDNDNWQLRDLDSSNGTAVNNQSQRKATLSSGDVISAGDTRLRVDIV